MREPQPPPIGVYEERAAACYDYDARAPRVAARVADLIAALAPELVVEHIGSTAVPELSGKGVVDLMVLYPPGGLERAKAVLDELGFQRQGTRDPWPESRPMRLGAIRFDGETFRLHAHVIAGGDEEVAVLRRFRDRLRNDPQLCAAYAERKRAILEAGVTDTVDYSYAKHDFIQSALDGPAAG